MKTPFFLGTLLILGASCQTSSQKEMSLREAVESSSRTEAFTQRDKYRHPEETLAFFKIKPDMTVIEISPGAGWYMEILAPYLTAKGQYIMATNKPQKAYEIKNAEKVSNWLDANPKVKAKVKTVHFDPPLIHLGEDNSADMVLTFRNAHNWIAKKTAAKAFKAFYEVLKPGGTLGVVEHRSPEKIKDPLVKSGYVRESIIIKLAKEAGFRLQEKSEINANLKDSTIHPKGVWTLPPTLSLKEKDREKYQKIGESDRMTIRFIKPVKK